MSSSLSGGKKQTILRTQGANLSPKTKSDYSKLKLLEWGVLYYSWELVSSSMAKANFGRNVVRLTKAHKVQFGKAFCFLTVNFNSELQHWQRQE